MRKQVLLFSTLVFIFLASCQKQETNQITPQTEAAKTLKSGVDDPCYEESYTIYAGQHIDVGTLTVSNDEENIFVTYDLSGTDWKLSETHLFVGNVDDLPLNGGGNPKIGHFPYSESHNGEQIYTYTLPREDFEECFAVAAHAVVVKDGGKGKGGGSETAWANGGTEFPGHRWGWYLEEYCPGDCEPDFVCIDGAFAYTETLNIPPYPERSSTCFTDFGFQNYGWNIGPLPGDFPNELCAYTELFSCPVSCDPNTQKMGEVRLKANSDGTMHVNFRNARPGYKFKNIYIYIGEEPLAQKNGNYTINPEDFPYIYQDVPLDLSRSANINDIPLFNGYIYAVVYVEFEEL